MTKKKTKRLAVLSVGLLIYTPNSMVTITEGAVAYAETYYSYAPTEDDCYTTEKKDTDTPDNNDIPTGPSSGHASDTDFTKKGSRAYKVAKNTWDGWVSKGLDGTMIAGILGNIGGAENMTWTLDLKEHGGGSGGGLYQFTPSTKYTTWSGFQKDWNELNQIEFILASEPQTILEYIKQAKGKTPREAAYLFGRLYERPREDAFQDSLKIRQDVAELAYKLFNGNNVKQDDEKIAQWSGGKQATPKNNSKSNNTKKGTSESKVEEIDCSPPCDTGSDNPIITNASDDKKTDSSGVGSLEQKIDTFVNQHEEAYLHSWKIGGFLPSASIVQTIAETSFSNDVPSFGKAHNMGGVKYSGLPYTATKQLYGSDAVSANGAGTDVGDNTGGSYAYFKHFDAGIVGKAEFMAHQTLYIGAINNTDGIATLDAIADGGWANDKVSYKNALRKLYSQYGERYKWLDKRAIAKHGKSPYKGNISTPNPTPISTTGLTVSCNDSPSAGGAGWQKKGGNSGYSSVMYWSAENLPDNMKQYALDPKSIGMAWKDRKGWEGASNYIAGNILDQCTTFSAACFGALWQKDGKNLGSFGLSGHGYQLVGQAESALGIKGSSSPTSGDLISMKPNHTAIVSHVFENGDILIVEQNVTGYSGYGRGEQLNWSYSYQTVSAQKQHDYEFINPSSVGYKITPNAKSVG